MSLADYACADEAAHVFAYRADCLTFLRSLPDNYCHAIITDPPYGLADHRADVVAQAITAWAAGDRERVPSGRGFMGREWDAFVPPPAVWDECLRVLRPGGHLAVFAGSRTVDLMGLSIRLAGFELRDGIAAWLYGSGFPKSLDVGKAIDKARDDRGQIEPVRRFLCAARDAAGLTNRKIADAFGFTTTMAAHWTDHPSQPSLPKPEQWERLRELLAFDDTMNAEVERLNERKNTWGNERPDRVIGAPIVREVFGGHGNVEDAGMPVLDAARAWSGWGTALKPAHEPIILARKPLAGTVAATVLAHGAGAINVDACRVAHRDEADLATSLAKNPGRDGETTTSAVYGASRPQQSVNVEGRWPTNVVLAHAPKTDPATGEVVGDACADGCVPGCQVAALDEQGEGTRAAKPAGTHARIKNKGSTGTSGIYGVGNARENGGHDGSGASRFYPTFRYAAKAPKSERPQVDGRGHPTVKPLGLMRWLVRLLVPTAEQLGRDENGHGPGAGLLIDPFAGSGTTLEAARAEGARAIGIEADEHSTRLIAARLKVEYRETAHPAVAAVPAPESDPFETLLAAVLAATTPDQLDALRSSPLWAPEHDAAALLRASQLTREGAAA